MWKEIAKAGVFNTMILLKKSSSTYLFRRDFMSHAECNFKHERVKRECKCWRTSPRQNYSSDTF
jgi:hypothetical protein